jgi:hypothetical protein
MSAKTRSEDVTPVPYLKPGQGFRGPENYGCINSGRQARISHLKITGTYLVGWDVDVFESMTRNRKNTMTQILDGKRTIHGYRYKVWQYKGRAAAVKKFHELNQKVLDFNESERERVRKYDDAVRRGDMTEAMRYAE